MAMNPLTRLQVHIDALKDRWKDVGYYSDDEKVPVVIVGRHIVKIDDASATICYVGMAVPGSGTDVDVWQIMRIDTETLTADVLFAGGVSSFTQIWDDRAELEYA